MLTYKEKTTFEERIKESKMIMEKYPDRIPVIVENSKKTKDIPEIDKNKYLVPKELTMGQMIYTIRKRIKLNPSQALFVMTEGGVLPPTSEMMINLYEKYADESGFLIFLVSGENTFG